MHKRYLTKLHLISNNFKLIFNYRIILFINKIYATSVIFVVVLYLFNGSITFIIVTTKPRINLFFIFRNDLFSCIVDIIKTF